MAVMTAFLAQEAKKIHLNGDLVSIQEVFTLAELQARSKQEGLPAMFDYGPMSK